MSEKPNDPGKKSGEDTETFEKLPGKQKDLHHLKEAQEKSLGKDREQVDKEIKKKTP